MPSGHSSLASARISPACSPSPAMTRRMLRRLLHGRGKGAHERRHILDGGDAGGNAEHDGPVRRHQADAAQPLIPRDGLERGGEVDAVIQRENALRVEPARNKELAHAVRNADPRVKAAQRDLVDVAVGQRGQRAAEIVEPVVAVDGGDDGDARLPLHERTDHVRRGRRGECSSWQSSCRMMARMRLRTAMGLLPSMTVVGMPRQRASSANGPSIKQIRWTSSVRFRPCSRERTCVFAPPTSPPGDRANPMSFDTRHTSKWAVSACQKNVSAGFSASCFQDCKIKFCSIIFGIPARWRRGIKGGRTHLHGFPFTRFFPPKLLTWQVLTNLISLVPLAASCNSAANLIESACLNIHYNIFCGKKQSDFSRFFRQLEVIL